MPAIAIRSMALFMAAPAMVVTITAPAVGDDVAGLPWPVTWAFSPGTQDDYRMVVYDTTGTITLYDSGVVSSEFMTANIPISVHLVSGVSYKAQVTIHKTALHAESTSALQSFTVTWVSPATLTGLALTKAGEQ